MSNKEVLLRVKDLKKYFQVDAKTLFQDASYVKANDGVTLEIYDGETLGLVGESGSGKTTFGRTLLQLYDQTGGATFYYGRKLEDLAPKYVQKTIKNLEKDVKSLEANRIDRRKWKANLEAAEEDKDREKYQQKYDEVDKKIDEYFDTTVKIFGGLVHADDLPAVSNLVMQQYELRGSIIKNRRELAMAEIELDALMENTPVNEKAKAKAEAKIKEAREQISTDEAALEPIERKIEAIREDVKNNSEKFERYEARRDDGIDLTRLTNEEMRHLRTDLQMIFQDPYSSLNPRMTIAQLIGEALVTHGMYQDGTQKLTDYIIEVMERCGLQAYMMHRYPHEFSGGQRQRIGIARALALQPRFVVCDEAVSALDVSIQSQIINLLKDLKEEDDLTYLFISHDLGVVRYISDRIGVMYLGDIVELAETDQIFNNTQHPYTEALLGAIPNTDIESRGQIQPLEGDIPSPVNPPQGCKFHTRCKYAMDICKREVPRWQEVEEGHFVACHLRDKEVSKVD